MAREFDRLQANHQRHKAYVMQHGEDLPEVRDWKWSDVILAIELRLVVAQIWVCIAAARAAPLLVREGEAEEIGGRNFDPGSRRRVRPRAGIVDPSR